MDNTLTDLNVVVDRKTWIRGKNDGSSRLLTEAGEMCCLGFAAIADGAKPEDIRNIGIPGRIHQSSALSRCLEGSLEEVITDILMTINDDRYLDDIEREAQLIDIGKKIKINFSFVG